MAATRAQREVYLDYSASTPVDPRVLEAMLPYFSQIYGNPSSAHRQGRRAQRAIDTARESVAQILNCAPGEIVFTSGGSESDNLALRGAAWHARHVGSPSRVITTPVEHSAVSNTVQQLQALMRFDASIAPVDRYGLVDVAAFSELCAAGGALASVIYANNELGSINDLSQLAAIAQRHGLLIHTDAVQAGGQLSLNVQQLKVDMLSLSAHKFYGPKGVGVLYVREGIQLATTQTGGGHEKGRRAGTHNTPFIVGLAKALELAYNEHAVRVAHFTAMRDRLMQGVLGRVPDARMSGHPQHRLPAHASFILPGVDANALLMHLDMHGIAASSGSACLTGNPEPSELLLAAGYSEEEAMCGLRLSVGLNTTAADVDYALDVLIDAVEKLRRLKAQWA